MMKWYTTVQKKKTKRKKQAQTECAWHHDVCMCLYILKHARIQHIHSKMAYTPSERKSERVRVCTSNIIIGTEPEAKRNKTQNTSHIRKMALQPCL